MSKRNRSTTVGIALIVTLSVWSMTSMDAFAQHMHQHGAQPVQQHQGHSPAGTMPATAARPTPHGGQFSVAGPLRFEVVYLPQETRVYLYDASNRPISARGAAGQVAMTVRGYAKVYRYPLAHVATEAGSRIQDYLAVTINVSRIKDGDMSVAFELTNLPSRDLPQARFTQTFALSKIPVTVAALTEADQAGVAKQKVCPVMGGKLGGMGTPVKVTMNGQSLFLCCKGCVAKVEKDPAGYFAKAAQLRAGR